MATNGDSPNQAPSNASRPTPAPDGLVLTPEEKKRRRARNIAIGVALGALVILFYVVTVAKLGINVMNRPL